MKKCIECGGDIPEESVAMFYCPKCLGKPVEKTEDSSAWGSRDDN